LNVYRLIRSEVREALRTIHELIKLTMLSYKYVLQVVLLLKSHVCFATLHKHYLVISVCIYDYCI